MSFIGGISFFYLMQGWQSAYHAGIVCLLVYLGLVGLMLWMLTQRASAQIAPGSTQVAPVQIKAEQQFVYAD